jgi:thioredoxin reductase (NADPH)
MDARTDPSADAMTDVAIIGAGPVGLFAVFEVGMLGFRATVVDVLDTAGGQCATLYPEKPIYDIPGYPTVMAMELIDRLLEQAAPFKPVYRLGHPVLRMTPIRARGDGKNDGWHLEIAGGRTVEARAIIIAGGTGAFGPVRLPLPGVEAYEGKSVLYLVRRKADLAGKCVVIAGGGDSAVDWALALAGIAAKVWVVHRRDKFRAAPESVRKMHDLAAQGAIEMVIPYQLSGLDGQGGHLTSVKVATLDGEEKSLPADVVLAFFGLVNNLGPIAEWGITLDPMKHIVVNPATCATNLHGVFAVGDIATYPGKLKLILSGFAEAAQAAHAIHPLLNPDKALHFEYSTSKGLPGAT